MRNFLLSSLFVLCVTWRCAAGIKCYQCASKIYENNTEINDPFAASESCAQLTGKTAGDVGNFTCRTIYEISEGITTISRGAYLPLTSTSRNYCTNSGSSTSCYCNSDSCNNEPINVPSSYDCYECQSSEYFDNGCGDMTFNAASKYVRTVKGCSACYKNVAGNGGHSLVYSRGCARSYEVDQSCVTLAGGQLFTSCACTGDLCNSAQTISIKSVSVFTAFILSLVVKLTC